MVYRVENDIVLGLAVEAKAAAEKAARRQAAVSLEQWAKKVVERYAQNKVAGPLELSADAVILLLRAGLGADFDEIYSTAETALKLEWRAYHDFDVNFPVPWTVKTGHDPLMIRVIAKERSHST